MATLTAKLDIKSTDLLSDSLSSTTTNTWTNITEGGIISEAIVPTTGGAAKMLYDLSDFTNKPAYVYLRNTDTDAAKLIYIRTVDPAGNEDNFIRLKGGEFAWFPWGNSMSIKVFAHTTLTILEHGCFSTD
tara:strand:+ start:1114 stop:1506 length:393 start_codon:yes stop_codon:yes gene_type:complete